MTDASRFVAAQLYNAALEHPTVSVAMRHLARKDHAFRGSHLVQQLAGLASYPDVSVGSLVNAARQAGLPLRGFAVDLAELDELPLPILAYLKRSPEPAARVDLIQIERVNPIHIVVSSDRFGQVRIPRAGLEHRWSGIALVADPDPRAPPGRASELNEYREQVTVIPDLLSRSECAELIELCEEACFRRSRVAQRAGEIHKDVVQASVRSSSSVVLEDRTNPLLARLYSECAAREGVRPRDIEHIQCVRYKKGQRFKAHFDGGVNLPRLTTYLLYLNDDFTGGETYFPLLDLAVTPVAGSALRFPSCDAEGRMLWPSEHGGLPVGKGVKYALNIWVRCPGVPVPRS
jgi:predicted 2-oxoglutarate/Fe(II)-dependent dioxygenase YbiX